MLKKIKPRLIDLGLPSGILWLSCNLGTTHFWRSGMQFHGDAASDHIIESLYGKHYRVPEMNDFDELLHTETRVGEFHGVPGMYFKSEKNGNTLFIPVPVFPTKFDKTYFSGAYWTKNLSIEDKYQYFINFYVSKQGNGDYDFNIAFNPKKESCFIRPVYDKKE